MRHREPDQVSAVRGACHEQVRRQDHHGQEELYNNNNNIFHASFII